MPRAKAACVYVSLSLFLTSALIELCVVRLEETCGREHSALNENKTNYSVQSELHWHDGDEIITDKNTIIPSLDSQYKTVLQKVENNIEEYWLYIQRQLHDLKTAYADEETLDTVSLIDKIINQSYKYRLTSLMDIQNLKDAKNMRTQIYQQSIELGNRIQNRLHFLQNPKDCDRAKKLLCVLPKDCGFGCQLHHRAICLIAAYATQRTMISNEKLFLRLPWDKFLKPLSDTCVDESGSTFASWSHSYGGTYQNEQVVRFRTTYSEAAGYNMTFLPHSIPADIAAELSGFHGHPITWWVGQFIKYLMRPKKHVEKRIQEITGNSFKYPIVGIHVRRTDKVGVAADFHPIESYMVHVEDYFTLLEMKHGPQRRQVYVATDDPTVFEDIVNKYPQYSIIGDINHSRSAGLSKRYSEVGLMGIIIDIHILSMCDFLVCTFSSNVCRDAFELLQTTHGDASMSMKSIDKIYFFHLARNNDVVAMERHMSSMPNELTFGKGDIINIYRNYWDGFSYGKLLGTNETGLFPSYKVTHALYVDRFPTYSCKGC